jgi:acyl dehydratase
MGGDASAPALKPDHDEPRLFFEAQCGMGVFDHAEGGRSPQRREVPEASLDGSLPPVHLGPERAAGTGVNAMGLFGILIALGLLI